MTLSLNADNCPRCGAIYNKNFRNLCPACIKEMDDMLNACDRYMWRHGKATTEQLQQDTGIPMDIILKFIKEDRKLRTKYYPNLTYPCEQCGRGIREARVCTQCGSALHEAFQPPKPAAPVRQPGIGFRINERLGK